MSLTTFFPEPKADTYYVASFVINRDLPNKLNAVDVYTAVRDKYITELGLMYYAIGFDETLLAGDEPHYHLTIIFNDKDLKNKVITKNRIQTIREKNPDWKLGQKMRFSISEWDGTMYPLGYATKDEEIEFNLGEDSDLRKLASYRACREQAREKKQLELRDFNKEQAKREHSKLLKDEVRDYLVKNVKGCLDDLKEFLERPGMREQYGYSDTTEYEAVRVCLEKYQIEHNKHFQTFELNKYVFDYYRYVRGFSAIEMYFLRVNNNIR